MREVAFAGGAVDHRGLRDALGRFATGVTVIATRTPAGRTEGMTANSFSAVSLDPPLVLWSIRRSAPSLAAFLEAATFAVSVLAEGQAELSHRFATPSADKFAGVPVVEGLGGCPLIAGAVATFECRLRATCDGGDHLVLIGEVLRAAYDEAPSPLVFFAGRYARAVAVPSSVGDRDYASLWDGLG